MDEETRATLIGALWFFSAVILSALFIGTGIGTGEFTGGHFALALVILGLAVSGTTYFLVWAKEDTVQEKPKRHGMDRLLDDLSDAELMELKRRLSDVEVIEQPIVDYLSEDGELVGRR